MTVYRGFIRSDKRDALSQNKMMIYRHSSDLTVTVLPKPGFVHRFVAFGIPYGAADQRFCIHHPPATQDPAAGWSSELKEVPPGTAHFLEHCIFSRDDEGGLISRLAELGAQANAYTTYTSTVYYFTCVDQVKEALALFFDALLHPQLDQARVDSERPIIQAEQALYHDDPDSEAYRTLMNNLYQRSGISEDVSGSDESVAAITAADLQLVADNFYIPAAMDIVLAGDYSDEELQGILDFLADSLTDVPYMPAGLSVAPQEPAAVQRPFAKISTDVGNSGFLLGFKNARVNVASPMNGADQALNQQAGQLYFETLLGEVSELYQTLFDEGVINDSFSIHYTCENDFACLILGSEADDPAAAAERVSAALLDACRRQTLDEEIFAVQKHALAGGYLRSLDSVESCGMAAVIARLINVDLFDYTSFFSRISAPRAQADMSFVLDEDCRSTVLIERKAD